MSNLYQISDKCHPSREKSNAYLYDMIPTIQNGIAVITSAGELLILDRQNLAASPVLPLQDVPQNVCCLVPGDDAGTTTLSCGSDGTVALHDLRSQARVSYFHFDKALTALARKGHAIAIGSELCNHQAVVSVWDQRQNRQIWQNAENNDDITALNFHPTNGNLLLAGGDDGQISLFDILVTEENDSLVQGVNHGPIHKAGFIGDQRFFALSSDQNLSIYPISSPGDEADPDPVLLGDLRPLIPCEYVIDIFQTGDGFAVAAGSNISNQDVKVIEIKNATNPNKTPKLKVGSGYHLQGAHGEEVVRSLFADDITGIIFTAGEDGAVQAYKNSGPRPDATKPSKASVSKKSAEGRYKPY